MVMSSVTPTLATEVISMQSLSPHVFIMSYSFTTFIPNYIFIRKKHELCLRHHVFIPNAVRRRRHPEPLPTFPRGWPKIIIFKYSLVLDFRSIVRPKFAGIFSFSTFVINLIITHFVGFCQCFYTVVVSTFMCYITYTTMNMRICSHLAKTTYKLPPTIIKVCRFSTFIMLTSCVPNFF